MFIMTSIAMSPLSPYIQPQFPISGKACLVLLMVLCLLVILLYGTLGECALVACVHAVLQVSLLLCCKAHASIACFVVSVASFHSCPSLYYTGAEKDMFSHLAHALGSFCSTLLQRLPPLAHFLEHLFQNTFTNLTFTDDA